MNKIFKIISEAELEPRLKPDVEKLPCVNCQLAVVLETDDMLSIYCKTFFKNVWTSHKKTTIKNCSDFKKFEEEN